jgi:hypothetical protein
MQTFAPKKCKIFVLLAIHNRLSTNETLARKGIRPNSTCPFECQTNEDISHIMFNCPYTSQIWQRLNFQWNQRCQVIQEAITNPRGTRHHKQEWGTILIGITRNLLLARNSKVFNNIDLPIQRIQANCLETITPWAHRSKKAES